MAKISTFFLIGGDHWIKKGVIIWLHRKGGGLERHSMKYTKYHAKRVRFRETIPFISEFILAKIIGWGQWIKNINVSIWVFNKGMESIAKDNFKIKFKHRIKINRISRGG